MNGGVIMSAVILAVVAFVEEALPRLLRAGRSGRRASERRWRETSGEARRSRTTASRPAEALPAGPSVSADVPVIRATPPATEAKAPGREAEPDETSDDRKNGDRLWTEAQGVPHGRVPDFRKDGDYLRLVVKAAQLGQTEAMVKLSEYAERRGKTVEAFYWMQRAELSGTKGVGQRLRKLRAMWLSLGCPGEHRNVTDGFTAEQGSFARAVLHISRPLDAPQARKRLRELADGGCKEARLYLQSHFPDKTRR